MRYRISRVSNYSGDRQPCSNAIKEGIDEYGFNMWWVNIDSLDDLHKLIEEVGTVIINHCNEIEIYDGYRE
jgi:hypothetical protein